MNIVFVSSEAVPYSKTGGLADVSGALPRALAKLGCKVSLVTPLYRSVDRAGNGIQRGPKDLRVHLGPETYDAPVHLGEIGDGVRSYLIGSPDFFERDQLYRTAEGDYRDNHLRFGFFARAVLELVRRYRLHPDVIHCNDWQSALVPVFSHQDYDGYFDTLLTIHNIGYQGIFPAEVLPHVGLDWDFYTLDGLEYWGNVNFLKGGLMFATKLSTVSPRYAEEIQSGNEYGRGLEGVLAYRRRDLSGILNGVDYGVWDPSHDKLLPATYDARDLSGKRACKTALQRAFGLPERPDVPLVGMISRLDAQKGFDLLLQSLSELLAEDVQFAVLGTGDAEIEQALSRAQLAAPSRFGLRIALDNPLAHLIEAGADIFLMPSHYEPCGLNQMYSLRYGAVPVVRATGGLDDTIEDGPRGNGFKFADYTAAALTKTLKRALSAYRDSPGWSALVQRGMAADFSWDRSAREYLDLYSKIVADA